MKSTIERKLEKKLNSSKQAKENLKAKEKASKQKKASLKVRERKAKERLSLINEKEKALNQKALNEKKESTLEKQAKERLSTIKKEKALEKLESTFENFESIKNFIESEREKEKKKSKLESFKWLYNQNESTLESKFAFYKKDFYIHNIELLENENEKALLRLYNQIESIWKWLNLNEIELIILEWLKARLMNEYIENFESNMKKANIQDIKKLNKFFIESNLKKYIKHSKESLNLIENENENIYWKQANNFESEYISKINKKFILESIENQERKKALNEIKEKKLLSKKTKLESKLEKSIENLKAKKRKSKKQAKHLKARLILLENEKQAKFNEIYLSKNKFEKAKALLLEKENLKSEYNLYSKENAFKLNENKSLIEINESIENEKEKALESLKAKEKKLFKSIKERESKLESISKKAFKKYLIRKASLKSIRKEKASIIESIYWKYESTIEKHINDYKKAQERKYKKHIENIKNINWKLAYIQKINKSEYWNLLKEKVKNMY